MIQLLPGLRIKVSNKHSTYGRVKVKTIQLFLGKYIVCLGAVIWSRSFGQNRKRTVKIRHYNINILFIYSEQITAFPKSKMTK